MKVVAIVCDRNESFRRYMAERLSTETTMYTPVSGFRDLDGVSDGGLDEIVVLSSAFSLPYAVELVLEARKKLAR